MLLAEACAAAAPAPTGADLAALEDLARQEAIRQLPPLSPDQRLAVVPIQRAAPLEPCTSPVSAAKAPGVQSRDRVLVELRCDSGKTWRLYVPVRVIGTSPVAVTRHAIVAGQVLKAEDLVLEQRDIAQLPVGYLNSLEIAVGLTAGRAIAGGAALTNQELVGTNVVQRGQTVTLVASNGTVSVRMPGKALSDGLLNQRIRVENLSSGKIVEGIARSQQVVEIVFQ